MECRAMKIQDSKSSNLTLSTSLFEELSEVELEAVSGGAKTTLVDVTLKNVDILNKNEILVAAQALTVGSTQKAMQ